MTIAVSAEPGVSLRPLRRAEYDVMVEQGLFEDERVELLEGALVQMSPQGGTACPAGGHAWEMVESAAARRVPGARRSGVKSRTYARSGVPEHWMIDVAAELAHVHTGPVGDGWQSIEQRPFTAPLDVAGVQVVLRDLLT